MKARNCHTSHFTGEQLTSIQVRHLTDANYEVHCYWMSPLNHLQRVQKRAAALVTSTRKRDHVTPILLQLHWLPIQQRSLSKILFHTKRGMQLIKHASGHELF